MRTISIANLKGGVGKTVTAINLAYLLAAEHGKRVLLIDNDQQGNASQFFNVYSYDKPSMSDVLEMRVRAVDVIQHTTTPNLDIIPANLSLAEAEQHVLYDQMRPRQTRLRDFLNETEMDYDYAIIDNSPSIGMIVKNSLVASDYLVITAKVDGFTFDGIKLFLEKTDEIKRYFNPNLMLLGTLLTICHRNDITQQGGDWIRQKDEYKVFRTHIRYTEKVDESTFVRKSVVLHSPRSNAARDYRAWSNELLDMIESTGGYIYGED